MGLHYYLFPGNLFLITINGRHFKTYIKKSQFYFYFLLLVVREIELRQNTNLLDISPALRTQLFVSDLIYINRIFRKKDSKEMLRSYPALLRDYSCLYIQGSFLGGLRVPFQVLRFEPDSATYQTDTLSAGPRKEIFVWFLTISL